MDRLNLTSEDAESRIVKRVQDRYRRVTSSNGLVTSRRVSRTYVIDPDVVTILPDFRIEGMNKVLRIVRVVGTASRALVDELSYDDVTSRNLSAGTPNNWGVKFIGGSYVIITFDRTAEESFTIEVEGVANLGVLSANDEPMFPEDFHDILVEGAMSDELRKLEKADLAGIAENNYKERLSDLKMFIAKSGYLTMYQGKSKTVALRPFMGPLSYGWDT